MRMSKQAKADLEERDEGLAVNNLLRGVRHERDPSLQVLPFRVEGAHEANHVQPLREARDAADREEELLRPSERLEIGSRQPLRVGGNRP